MATGRGCWSVQGKANDSVYYQYVPGKPTDGSTPQKGPSYLAVNYAVKAIQAVVNAHAYDRNAQLVVDGDFGPKTAEGVRVAQTHLKVEADGQVGPKTVKALFLPQVNACEIFTGIPGHYLAGLIRWESYWDPGAVGLAVDNDHGMCQINATAHPDITLDQAFNPSFAIPWAGHRLIDAYHKYGQNWHCGIASYNSPNYAQQWLKLGAPPNAAISTYVERIMAGDA